MLSRGLLLAMLFGVSTIHGADLHILPNETVKGDLVSIDAKTVVMKTEAGNVAKPLMSVLQLELQPIPASVPTSYLQVALIDGSVLNCKPNGFLFDGKRVQLTLLAETKIDLPITALSYFLKDAHDPKVKDDADWKSMLKSRRNQDMLVKWFQGRLNGLSGTFPDGKATSLNFIPDGRDTALAIDLTNKAVQGCIFVNKLDPSAPATVCKLYDVHQNVFMVSSLEVKEGGDFEFTTVSGAKLQLARNLAARVDYSTNKRVYLSDLDPVVLLQPGDDTLDRYRRDRTSDTSQLKMGSQHFTKGLFIPAPTKLVYKLDGDYSEFTAVIGVDDGVRAKNPARLIIEGDGKELFTGEFKKSEKPRDIRLNVKDVQELRITVESVTPLGFVEGCHLNLADAKISK